MAQAAAADLNTVYSLLRNALSQDEAVRKPSEATLSALENLPGFCSCLLEIISVRDLEEENGARWLASVYFKNSINRYWRARRETPGITDAEKPYLRSKLLDLIREENNQIAIQLAVLISKIARIDYPREWQDLFPALLQKLQSSDMLTTHRVYMVLHHILKELSSKRLAADQQNFAQITSQLFDFTWHHWCSDTQVILSELSAFVPPNNASLSSSHWLMLDRWLICLKILGRLVCFGFASDAKAIQEVAPVKQVCPAFLQSVQSFLQYRAVLQEGHPLFGFIEKACLKLMKVLNAIQATHPFSFSDKSVLPPVLEFVCLQITQQKQGAIFERFLIQCMLFVQAVLQCKEYRANKITGRVLGSAPGLEDRKMDLERQAENVIRLLVNNDLVLRLCDAFVTRYFVYTSADLESWAENAEVFHHEESVTQWREKLRPCAEALYLVLFANHRELLAPYVVDALKRVSADFPPPAPGAEVQITPALLSKDAVYNAIGIAHYDLDEYIDFKSWYNGALALEVINAHPNNRIMRRRVAKLFGCWVSQIKEGLRRPIYADLLRLLGDHDIAVQLAAVQSLNSLIDDVSFYEEEFVEFVPALFDMLFQSMSNAQEFDSKVQFLNLVSLIVDRLGEKATPCTDKLLVFLSQMWQMCESEILLRIQVILALQRLVIALGPRSPACYKLLIPVLQYITDAKQPEELNMLEDGLLLWKATLKHAPVLIPELLELFPHAVVAVERSLDELQVCMEIIESYVLLGGAEFLMRHGGGVVAIFKMVIGHVNEKGMLRTLPVLDVIVQCFPTDAPPLLEEVLQRLFVLVVSGKDESDIVRAASGAILARVLVQNSSFFARMTSNPSLLHALQQSGVQTTQNPLILFFDSWLDKVDSLITVSKRKLCALATCILLTCNEPQVLDRLEQILSVCTSVLYETENGVNNSYDYPAGTHDEDARKIQIATSDPVNKLALAPLLKEKLQTCAALHGEAAFNAALSRCAPSLLRDLQQL